MQVDIPVYTTSQNNENYNDELSRSLTGGLSNNGWQPPEQSTDNLVSLSENASVSTLWIDTDKNQMVAKMPDGNLYSFNMTPYTP